MRRRRRNVGCRLAVTATPGGRREPGIRDTPVLAAGEVDRLAELEQIVEQGLVTFVEVGRALTEIRDGRLYRETYPSFEQYLEERWGMSRSRGYRLIEGATVAELVSPVGDIPNERQARELVPLLGSRKDGSRKERELVDVWRELRDTYGDAITADKVRAVVQERLACERQLGNIFSSRSCEWYTPSVYVDAARDVLGGIDLDPASCEQANRTVRATVYYDARVGSLARDWHGRVFLNPPYGGMQARFVAKVLAEHAAGRVEAAVLLLNAYGTDAAWFQPLFDVPLCFTDHRISFSTPVGTRGGSTFGSVFAYLGPGRSRFVRVFRRFGAVVERSTRAEAA